MATTFTELLKAVKKSDPTFENLKVAETEAEFSTRLLTAVGSLSDEAWASLPVDDQNWFNSAAVALNANEPVIIPGFDLGLADGGTSEAVEEPAAADVPAKGKSEKAIAAEAAKADKLAKAESAKAEKVAAAEKVKADKAAEKAERAAAAKVAKPAKPIVDKASSYIYTAAPDGSIPATLFLRQQIVNNFLAGKETDSKGLAAAAEAAGVAVNESTINTVFNHALGFLRAINSLGASIVKK
jgi:hypothetical protein